MKHSKTRSRLTSDDFIIGIVDEVLSELRKKLKITEHAEGIDANAELIERHFRQIRITEEIVDELIEEEKAEKEASDTGAS